MRISRRTAIAIGAVLFLAAFASGQGGDAEKSATPNRYQLLAATVQGFQPNGTTDVEQRVFMVDTETGKVWSYVPSGPFSTPSGNPGFTPEMFVRVFVDGLEGSVPEQMQRAVEYYDKHPATPVPPRR